MSDARVKSEKSKAKDKRQTPAPDVLPKHRSRNKEKHFAVESKDEYITRSVPRWRVAGKYQDLETARKVIEDYKRKNIYPDILKYSYRIRDLKTKEIIE